MIQFKKLYADELSGVDYTYDTKSFKLDTITDNGYKVYLFQNDWTQTGGSVPNVWQISSEQRYQVKSSVRWMNLISAG